MCGSIGGTCQPHPLALSRVSGVKAVLPCAVFGQQVRIGLLCPIAVRGQLLVLGFSADELSSTRP